MTVKEILTILGAGGGGLALVVMTLVEVMPVKVNPWSAVAKAIGRAMNADVLKDLAEVKKAQGETRSALEAHIREDDERAADSYRERILSFNLELMRNQKHTREDYVDVLAVIDKYHAYCEQHPNYPNSRATHAVANIERVYDERMERNDFL